MHNYNLKTKPYRIVNENKYSSVVTRSPDCHSASTLLLSTCTGVGVNLIAGNENIR